MAIYITGGGDQENFQALDQHFTETLPNDAQILIIPWASEEEEYEDVFERIEHCFENKKIKSFEMASNPQEYTWEKLKSYDALMIEGGNTFQLIKSIRETSFNSILKKYATETNKLIYADSAGAILLGSDVKTAFLGEDGDEDHHKLQDYRGLDLIEPWSVHAHYEPDDWEQLENLLYEDGNPIIALAEPAGLLYEDGKLISLGHAPVELVTFSGKEILNFEEQLTF
jgi:peptidase E